MNATMVGPRTVEQANSIPNSGYWKLEFVTPEQAQKYIDNQAPNRSHNKNRTTKLCRAIKEGRYRLTHQGIALDEHGRLADGQHRCFAIIKAGVGVWIWVYRGLSADAMPGVDDGRPRSPADAMRIEGMTDVTSRHIAIAKSMAVGPASEESENMWTGQTWDRDDLIEFLNQHGNAIEFVARIFPRSKGLGHAAVAAVLARAYYHVDREELSEFADIMKSQIATEAGKIAPAKLAKFLSNPLVTGGGSTARVRLYRKTQSCLRAFLDRKPILKVCEVSEDLFPLPKQ